MTSAVPMFIPPIHILTPWLFEATMLGDAYEKGRLVAYTLLCDLSLRSHDIPLSAEYVTRYGASRILLQFSVEILMRGIREAI